MTEKEVAAAVEDFVRRNFGVSAADQSFSQTVDLFEDGYIDSIGVVELLEFIRATFGVEVPEEELFSPEFASIEGISRIVARSAPAGR